MTEVPSQGSTHAGYVPARSYLPAWTGKPRHLERKIGSCQRPEYPQPQRPPSICDPQNADPRRREHLAALECPTAPRKGQISRGEGGERSRRKQKACAHRARGSWRTRAVITSRKKPQLLGGCHP
uniref:Uncharacterized protein n=1 Tax=Pipistrellus kuhlii TaxID=59472 RepID=A0A7J7YMJ0_PIPKU|nr:hypothetical protein mPipKuh1_010121 [Pipistrellus kuhlii]